MLVLAIESDATIVRHVRTALTSRGGELVVCDDLAEALLYLGRLCPDAVVLGGGSGRIDTTDFLTIVR
jgi:DNA-binding response OmpR family regulator